MKKPRRYKEIGLKMVYKYLMNIAAEVDWQLSFSPIRCLKIYKTVNCSSQNNP
jgi:hypothetical protein